MDGGPVDELEYESFNACRATVCIQRKKRSPWYSERYNGERT